VSIIVVNWKCKAFLISQKLLLQFLRLEHVRNIPPVRFAGGILHWLYKPVVYFKHINDLIEE